MQKLSTLFINSNPSKTEVFSGITELRNAGPESIPGGYCCNPVATVPDPQPPSGLPAASLWFDASDSNNISVISGNITGFTDKTGNSNNGVAYNGDPIQYNQNPINGLGTVRIDQISVPGQTLKVTNYDFNDQYLTYAIVGRWISGSRGILATDTPGRYGRGIGVTDTGTLGKLQTISYNDFTTWDGSSGIPDINIPRNSPFTLITSVSEADWIVSINGVQYTLPLTQAKLPDNDEGLNIGTWNPTNYQDLLFDLGECLVYRSSLTVGEVQKVEGYFATKWGLLGNLPVGHPYKNGYP